MSQVNNEAETSATKVTIETNNFHNVLKHFDITGNLIHKSTAHLAIECQICMVKNLALINPRCDDATSEETHEKYVILPACGHAFGHSCLRQWLKAGGVRSKCPSCRSQIYCQERHVVPFKICGIEGNNMTRQAMEIRGIRAILSREPFCTQCEVRSEPQARIGGLPQNQRPPQVNPRPPIQEVQARGQDIARQAVIGAEAVNSHDQNRPQSPRATRSPEEYRALLANLDRALEEVVGRARELGI
ncbi:hypothetical protein HD806DRAFT_530232 [Xylariaceae sp. AK1471]|nr:hypothetical protein HD806DRAFT_530232 [Xylariaceae sp. AK1471]